MKKEYIRPGMTVIAIETNPILAGSSTTEGRFGGDDGNTGDEWFEAG